MVAQLVEVSAMGSKPDLCMNSHRVDQLETAVSPLVAETYLIVLIGVWDLSPVNVVVGVAHAVRAGPITGVKKKEAYRSPFCLLLCRVALGMSFSSQGRLDLVPRFPVALLRLSCPELSRIAIRYAEA